MHTPFDNIEIPVLFVYYSTWHETDHSDDSERRLHLSCRYSFQDFDFFDRNFSKEGFSLWGKLQSQFGSSQQLGTLLLVPGDCNCFNDSCGDGDSPLLGTLQLQFGSPQYLAVSLFAASDSEISGKGCDEGGSLNSGHLPSTSKQSPALWAPCVNFAKLHIYLLSGIIHHLCRSQTATLLPEILIQAVKQGSQR